MLVATKQEAKVTEAMGGDGTPRKVLNYFGLSGQLEPGPQGFMVTSPPNSVGRPHFHTGDQFQVFFGTEGSTFGRHPMPPVYVHYTDEYTPYGPFASGPQGMEFFTLRAEPVLGTFYMPESREKLIKKAGRGVSKGVETGKGEQGKATCTPVMERQADGMAAYHIAAGPGGKLSGPSAEGSKGQYYVVVAGVMECQGKKLGRQSMIFVNPGDLAPEMSAGSDEGFDAVVLQYPLKQAA